MTARFMRNILEVICHVTYRLFVENAAHILRR